MRMIEEVVNMFGKMMLVEFVDDLGREDVVVVVDAVVVADNLMGSRVVVVVMVDALWTVVDLENQVFVVVAVVVDLHIHRNLA